MIEIYPDKELFDKDKFHGKQSIFLAGPTPRHPSVTSWRPEALRILRELKYDGVVLIPERSDWNTKFAYDDQVAWEEVGLRDCTEIVFWIPRNMDTLPGLTTNVEFGRWISKRNESVYYGRPDNAEHVRYLDWLHRKEKGAGSIFNSLDKLLGFVVW